MEKPKMKKGNYLIVIYDRYRNRIIKKYIDGRIFEYKGIKFGLYGKTGNYTLTHIETGLGCSLKSYYNKLYDFLEDIDFIVERLKIFDIEKIKEEYKDCEIVRED